MRDEKVVLEEDEGREMGEPTRVWDGIDRRDGKSYL